MGRLTQFISQHKAYIAKVIKLAVLTVGLLALIRPPLISANGDTVVSIFVDGQKKVVATSATTVGEVLSRAQVNVTAEDLVEPGRDSKFSSEIFNINVYRAKPVVLVDGTNQIRVNSPYQNPKLIAERSANLTVYPEDEYQTELIQDFLQTGSLGTRITINRALPITLKIDGLSLPIRTQQKTVGEMLKNKGVVVEGEDQLSTPADTPISAGMEVSVIRVGREVMAEEEAIPREVQVVYDNNLPRGAQQVRQEGSDGKRVVTYEVVRHDGQIVQKNRIQAVTVTEMQPKIIVIAATGADWAGLRQCEAGGNYSANTGNGYYGAYQFSQSTWNSVGGSGNPANASPAEQDYRAQLLYQRAGRGSWPVCGPRYLP